MRTYDIKPECYVTPNPEGDGTYVLAAEAFGIIEDKNEIIDTIVEASQGRKPDAKFPFAMKVYELYEAKKKYDRLIMHIQMGTADED